MVEQLAGLVGIDERLRVMRALGYRFGTSSDDAGLVGARVHHGVIDIIQFFGEQDAEATRISCTEADLLFPRVIFWHTNGSSSQVIDALLGLADPDHHSSELSTVTAPPNSLPGYHWA